MGVFTQIAKRFTAIFLCFVITVSALSLSLPAHAVDYGVYDSSAISEWLSRYGVFGDGRGGNFGSSGKAGSFGGGRGGGFASNRPQNYYTTPTQSVEDKYGNVTNYYRGGDTTSTKIIDSYNQTFNTIHNTSNTTNNYSANVKLSDFLNTYTTNNNNYTYNTRYNSWYYDNTQNTLNYDASQTYYQTDNRQYFVSIDNSTDEYYLIDVQYSPTFVTVNYTYNNIDNSTHYGDVTNVYYFELTDGRNSSTLSASEVGGLDLGYDVTNYEQIVDDPNTLALFHFDGDYSDSSGYARDSYVVYPSTQFVDTGAFGKAVKLQSGYIAGVQIPGLSDLSSFAVDFRVNYSSISSLGIFIGDDNIFAPIPGKRIWNVKQTKLYDGETKTQTLFKTFDEWNGLGIILYHHYTIAELNSFGFTYGSPSDSWSSAFMPTSWDSVGYTQASTGKYGLYSISGSPQLVSSDEVDYGTPVKYTYGGVLYGDTKKFTYDVEYHRNKTAVYEMEPSNIVAFDFPHATYANQWVPIRLVYSGGKLYFYVNGGFVGSGNFTVSDLDVFYLKSFGTLYLDELRITTGDMVSIGTYTPSSVPYDTNKVLALPDDLVANTIYVRHSIPVTSSRIGGVRPSNPTTGFFYIPLHDDYTGGQPQLYDGSNWVDVEAMIYDGTSVKSALGYEFSPCGFSPDVDMDAKPERPTKPGEDVDPDTCTHEWKEGSSIKPSCVMAGTVTLKCSKCGSTKTETIPKLNHIWEVKTSVQTTYDDEGNVVTQGYTIYKCSVCGDEYKDTEGTGPPSGTTSGSDDEEESGGFLSWLGGKLGDLFGAIGGGILSLLQAALGKVLDGLINLVNMVFEKLSQIVDLFGSFGDALGVLWTWLPPEIMTVLVAAVTVFVFVALLKLFLK